ncbi:MAG: TIGR00269 family protein [Cuniculiplasma sp.]
MKCARCDQIAVFESKPSHMALCRGHFMESVEKRFRTEIRKQVHFRNGNTTIGVAISGGKDSSVLLHLLWKTLNKKRNVILKAFTIDEGIEGYRNAGLISAQNLCKELRISHDTISFRDGFNTEMDKVVRNGNLEGSPCAYCGPMRRDLMNRMSEEFQADYVALGINLDDYSQSIMMNVLRGDYDKMLRMAPHRNLVDGLVPRIIPLRKIYEKEVKLYAILAGIEHDMGWCPYSMEAQRNKVRDLLNRIEEESPGTKLAIEGFLEKLQQAGIGENAATLTQKCSICGNPSNGPVCQGCIRSGRFKEDQVPTQKKDHKKKSFPGNP